jgi:hypothetical protein
LPLWGGDITTLSCGDCPWFLAKNSLVRFAALPPAAERNLELFPGFSKDLYGLWASYRLAARLAGSGHKEEGTPDTTPADSRHSGEDSSHSGGNSSHTGGNSSHNNGDSSICEHLDPVVLEIAENARTKNRLTPQMMRNFVGVLAPGKRAMSGNAPDVAAVVPIPVEENDVAPDADTIDGVELAHGF